MGKEKDAKRFNFKIIALLLALMLTVGGVIGGTVAWLIASSDPVINTFTYGDINIELDETDTKLDNDGEDTTNQYEMIPGQTITKDPVITVKKDSEDMWLFVKLEKSENFGDFMEYEVAEGWTALDGVDSVYYQKIEALTVENADEKFAVIKDNKVTVKESVTKEQLNALDPEGTEAAYPTLTVTAYAVQYAGFEPEVSDGATASTPEQISLAAAEAWKKITGDQTTTP